MINKWYQSKSFPLLFQVAALFVFFLLIAGAWGVTTDNAAFAKQLRNTNLANLIVWSYWWPFIVLTAVFFGRHWCSICPIELITAIVVRFGWKRKAPKTIKTAWSITFLYAFVAIVAISTWGVHRYPNRMAFYLLGLIGLAVVVSLLFEKRAFCSYFCPVGKLLGLYSLMAKWGLRVKNKDICKSCKTKDCVAKVNNYKLIGRSCQSNLYPANISDNRACILCTQCTKVCPSNNIKLQPVSKSYSTFDLNKLTWAEVGMLTILLGFICYEILSSWAFSKSALLYLPTVLYTNITAASVPKGLFNGAVLYLLMPSIYLFFFSALAKLTGKASFSFYLKRTVGFLLPIVAFGHVFKALMKTTSRLPYWEYALQLPDGMAHAKAILDKEIVLYSSISLELTVLFLGIAGLSWALYISLQKIVSDYQITKVNKQIYAVLVVLHFLILVFGPFSRIFNL